MRRSIRWPAFGAYTHTRGWTRSRIGTVQCRVNTYDCRDFSTQFQAQAVYWACGGRQNDVHRLDRDRDGWACEALP